MKKILIVGYSQTGQLNQILQNIAEPLLENEAIALTKVDLIPQENFPFPWSFFSFFSIFPECVMMDAQPNQNDPALDEHYDLVILGYQPWFLSPSLPTSAFLKSEQAKLLFKNTPVITVVGCRNMWGQAHLKVKEQLASLGANHIDNIVLQDQGPSFATFITTPLWLLTGKKDGFLNFPPAGISPKDITNACRFGKAISHHISEAHEIGNQPILSGLGAVKANASLLQSEKIGARSFHIWGTLIRKLSSKPTDFIRIPILIVYIAFLIVMILTVVPLSMLLRKLLNPFFSAKISALEAEFEKPSGSSTSRINDFKCDE